MKLEDQMVDQINYENSERAITSKAKQGTIKNGLSDRDNFSGIQFAYSGPLGSRYYYYSTQRNSLGVSFRRVSLSRGKRD